jgi:hypothetical protein
VSGQCVCANNQTTCNGQCVDLQTSQNHCGSCGNACGALQACNNGQCGCDPSLTACSSLGGGSVCRDLKDSPQHCGACGTQCSSTQYCLDGSCTCRPGFVSCNGPNGAAACVNPQNNPLACGGCGTQCSGQTTRCSKGACVAQCAQGETQCIVQGGGGTVRYSCTNTQTDPRNCGICGNTCDNNEICIGGQCRDYAPASPCNSCPCTAVCNAVLPGPGTKSCCAPLGEQTEPICVRHNVCP